MGQTTLNIVLTLPDTGDDMAKVNAMMACAVRVLEATTSPQALGIADTEKWDARTRLQASHALFSITTATLANLCQIDPDEHAKISAEALRTTKVMLEAALGVAAGDSNPCTCMACQARRASLH